MALEDEKGPPVVDVWEGDTDKTIKYVVLKPWQWIMDNIRKENMSEVSSPAELPSFLAAQANPSVKDFTPTTRRRRAAQKQRPTSSLKIEICDSSGKKVLFAAHGSSAALDGLEDKDELIRTMQRCRCDHKNISPPSLLINWDVSHEECLNLVGKELPCLAGNQLKDKYVVLKKPMGSGGDGVFFVRTAEEIHVIVEAQQKRAHDDPGFLDELIAAKGRIPSWVLQAEVHPCLLIKGRRKFHIRTYVVVLEMLYSPDLLEAFIFNRHEVRIAGLPVPVEEVDRDRGIHITNGGLTDSTERILLDEVEELTSRGMKEKIELFVGTTFGKDIIQDMAGRIRVSANDCPTACKFAVAGLDLMVTEDNRIYLLEVNANPAAPREATVTGRFKTHLQGFMHDLTTLVTTGNPTPTFLSANDIMEKHGVSP